jgi:hypothetical protein
MSFDLRVAVPEAVDVPFVERKWVYRFQGDLR